MDGSVIGGGLDLQICPRVGELDIEFGQIPPMSLPCPHGGRWGKTLISALVAW